MSFLIVLSPCLDGSLDGTLILFVCLGGGCLEPHSRSHRKRTEAGAAQCIGTPSTVRVARVTGESEGGGGFFLPDPGSLTGDESSS